MSTSNNWNNQIAAAKTAITLNSGSNNINISTDAAETNVHIADSAATKKYVTMGSSVDDSSTAVRCGTGGATFGTSANQHTTTVGSTNAASATTVQSGTGSLNITSTNGPITIASGTGTIGISTSATNSTVNVGTGAGVKATTLGSLTTTSSTTINTGTGALNLGIGATDHATSIGSQTGASATTIYCGTDGLLLGTAPNQHSVTIGSTNGASSVSVNVGTGDANFGTSAVGSHLTRLGSTYDTSSTTLQSGTGALAVTSTGGTLTINSGTGALGISTDASATTCNVCTGAASKVVTMGSTNTTSSLALKYGTADFTLASATGTVMSALDTGEITKPLQPAFLACVSTGSLLNKTGAGTDYTIVFATEIYDVNSDFDGTSTFTAPVSGKYTLTSGVSVFGCTIARSPRVIALLTLTVVLGPEIFIS